MANGAVNHNPGPDALFGTTDNANAAGVSGNNTSGGPGVRGISNTGEGVHGESHSATTAGSVGVALNPNGTGAGVFGESIGKGAGVAGVNKTAGGAVGVFGESESREGIFGISRSSATAAVAGIAENPNGTGAGVFGESQGKGAGVAGINKSAEGAVGVFGESEGREGVFGISRSAVTAAVAGIGENPNGTGAGVFGESKGKGAGVVGVSATFEGVHGESHSATAAGVAGLALNPNGTGAGVFGESQGKGPAGFFKGDVFVTGDIKLINADCAEDFDIAGTEQIEPGTVMVLNPEGALQQSQQAYDKHVAGVISGAGGYKPGIVLDKQQRQGNRLPVALLGKVYCKVDAQYGSVEVGDLLTTSPTPGHAMKAGDPLKAFGTVIGKALRSLQAGQGMIPILIALQ